MSDDEPIAKPSWLARIFGGLLEGNRKLVAFFVGILAIVGLAKTGHAESASIDGIVLLVVAFCGGNIAEHLPKLRGGK